MANKNILILTNRDISKASRVIRELEALDGNFNIFILSNFEGKSLNARIIQDRLAIVFLPKVEMKTIKEKYNIDLVVNSF